MFTHPPLVLGRPPLMPTGRPNPPPPLSPSPPPPPCSRNARACTGPLPQARGRIGGWRTTTADSRSPALAGTTIRSADRPRLRPPPKERPILYRRQSHGVVGHRYEYPYRQRQEGGPRHGFRERLGAEQEKGSAQDPPRDPCVRAAHVERRLIFCRHRAPRALHRHHN